MNDYMLTVLVKNDLDEKKRGEILEGIKKQFSTLTKEDLWGNRGLSYPINHHDKAYYAHYEFQLEPDKIASLDRVVKLNENILRYLLLKVDKKAVKAKRVVKISKKSQKEEPEESKEPVEVKE